MNWCVSCGFNNVDVEMICVKDDVNPLFLKVNLKLKNVIAPDWLSTNLM